MPERIQTEPVLRVKNLNGFYGKKQILFNLNLNFRRGNIYAVAGPNGAGKTTLLKLLTGQLHVHNGDVYVNGSDINSLTKKELAKHISLVPQNSNTDVGLTVEEIVAMGRFCHKTTSNKNRQAIGKALNFVRISEKKQYRLSSLSGGEAQLTMIARAICQDTEIIILDEPLNNLDPFHCAEILKILRLLADEGKCVITVMHDLNAVLKACDFCIFMKSGSVVSCGKTEETVTEENILKTYGTECRIIRAGDRTPSTFCCTP